jgi:hypothetical protein
MASKASSVHMYVTAALQLAVIATICKWSDHFRLHCYSQQLMQVKVTEPMQTS